jgi:hypothetical protein
LGPNTIKASRIRSARKTICVGESIAEPPWEDGASIAPSSGRPGATIQADVLPSRYRTAVRDGVLKLE